ncbi:xanthine dehydrogenase family protein molybdopterin-binding subunit [Nocardiopsis sp. HNM0947]|uniref:Xanthine dehydrogenase family protein molybdopterin-binding subunit n=1 Tax=Nocardiopsis coralli TaxID=2772213 RepID=A0ABR9PCK2_9ACTN|nr:xanthine dehydrogenase family protein molybdopterin-binding subunit [Nocardiopsis coralli]MBE3001560.1 xanthine dehydrogenase family protein molybdopterin-binding subunit [Nocardiopsis coralli]
MSGVEQGALGRPDERVEGWDKVAGRARYAYEQPVPALYVHPVLSTVARGRVLAVDTGPARASAGVEAVLTHENAERLADTSDAEFAVLQGPHIGFCGQIVAAVVARTPEEARRGADLVQVREYAEEHDVVLGPGHPRLYCPDELNAYPEADTRQGDPAAALERAPVVLDRTYRTPMEHNNPMEPHACTVLWEEGTGGGSLTVYDSTQGVHPVRESLAQVLGLHAEQVRVVSEHVGGGFGSKGSPHAHNVVAALAARAVPGRWVKLALTRQQMFTLVGHRTPTIQRVRLGAARDGVLSAVVHDVEEHTSTVKEFAEQSAVCTRMMYAAPHRRTTHRLAALDVPIPFWMRAPGETPGMFALESALDELACELAMDPIVLRERNEPDLDPETGAPWSDRRLVQCLHEGARRFGWAGRDGRARSRREGEWWVGTGVASAVYPHFVNPGSEVEIVHGQGVYTVSIGAADIGTGARTVLGQIAADALSVPAERVRVRIGDTALPPATVAGGSAGTSSWGSAVVAAARALREEHGSEPGEGARARAGTPEDAVAPGYSVYSFGAHFVEARVHADTGEVRVPRMYGLFSVGRVLNPRLARSQLVGGMVMGLSMALHEHTVMDARLGHVVNHDLAQYHVAAHADVQQVEAEWLEGADVRATPMGSRGVGEIGIVGAAAAVANAAHHATGVRVRNLPLTPDRFLVGPRE